MKRITQLHYMTVAFLLTVMLEGLLTMGDAFKFENYNTFGWIVQAVIVAFALLTALRAADKA